MTEIFAETALLPEGWAHDVTVRIEDGRIAAVAAGPRPAGAEAVGVLLPAPSNLHSHAFQRAMAGLTEARGPSADSFWTWRRLMYRFLDRLTPDQVEAIAAFAQMEMAEAGYAACAEFHYLHHRPDGAPHDDLAEMSARIAAAAADTGLGLTHLPVLYTWASCEMEPLGPGQVRFGNDIDRFARLVEGAERTVAALPGDARVGVAAHSLRAVDPDGLTAAADLRPNAPFHMHIAEQTAEVEEVRNGRGARPVEWLLNIMDVDARWCLIHCTHMTPAETEGLARSGAVAGLCPVTESSLGDGVFNGVQFSQAGGAWGYGTDSNIRISLAEEMRTLEYSLRLAHRGRAMLAEEARSTGRVLFEAACRGGAQAAGRDSGAIEAGRLADLMALDAGATDLIGRTGDRILDAWIFAGDDRWVRDVWSAGRRLVSEGRHPGRARIEARYRAAMADLAADL